MTSVLKKVYNKKPKERNNYRVYGLESYNQSYDIPRRVLSWVTIKMTHNISELTTKYWVLFYWFEFFNIGLSLIAEVGGMVLMVKNAENFRDGIKVFRMIPCFGCVVMAIVKSIKIILHRPVFENLANELRDLWPHGEISDEEHLIVSRSLQELNFIITGYYWCNIALLTSFLSPPYFLLFGRYLGYNYPMQLHFVYWLPFDAFQPYVFEFMLILQTWQALVVIFCNLSWDMLFCTFLSHITTQFDLLARRIRRLILVPVDTQLIRNFPLASISDSLIKETEVSNYHACNWEEQQQKKLKETMERHQTLIRLASDVEKMFSFALLINFMNSSVIICFCGFCCVLVEKWNDIAYKSFLLTALSQTWLLCWYGQKLLDSSLNVSAALYECGWYTSSQKIKKSVFIMLHRAQKGIRVTTYGFSTISLSSFTMIIKTAWSYFTLLLNFYNNK